MLRLAMNNSKAYELSEFFPDSSSLQFQDISPTEHLYVSKINNRYEEIFKQDPLEILGEKSFGKPRTIPEDCIGTPIQEFFRGANVFITGGTGFVGKVLTEKLIRSIPHLGKIYLLLRPKRGKSSKERFEQMMEDQVFSRMKTEVPHYHTKISIVEGDIREPGLGLSSADRQLLIDSINIVFHSAADVRFSEPLKPTVHINTLGSRKVLELGKEMKHLKSYVHVSTAFSQCVRRVIEENIPKMSPDYNEVLNLIDNAKDESLEEDTPRILQGWPNTYTFSKALCEDMIQEEAKGLPICIVRPSIVLPTYKEPVRGYTDNVYGPIGVILGCGLGVLHSFKICEESTLDVVPVDFLINLLMAAAWSTGTKRSREEVAVYNFTSCSYHIWKTFLDSVRSVDYVWPFSRAIWAVSAFTTESKLVNDFSYYVLHRLPGLVFDKLAELSGEKPILTKTYQRMRQLEPHLNYFSDGIWEFKSEQVANLWYTLDEADKSMFCFDLAQVDFKKWAIFFKLGCRYYLMKDKMEDIPSATRKYKWLYYTHKCLQLLFGVAALKLMVFTARTLPI